MGNVKVVRFDDNRANVQVERQPFTTLIEP